MLRQVSFLALLAVAACGTKSGAQPGSPGDADLGMAEASADLAATSGDLSDDLTDKDLGLAANSDLTFVQPDSDGTDPVSHGPLIGHIAPDRANIWLRTAASAQVAIEYRPQGGASQNTETVTSATSADYTVQLSLAGLTASTVYDYRVLVDGVAGKWHSFRSAPSAADPGTVNIAFFSDSFGSKPGPGLHAAVALHPNLALTIGDWDHRNPTTLERSREMHRELRGSETALGTDVAATLIAQQIPLYATWDDHDYCKNNSNMGCGSRDTALQAWGEYHPFSDDHGFPNGIWQRFRYGLVEVFVLDTRSNRDPHYCAGCRSILGAAQQAWLLDRLSSSTAPWKIIVTSTPFNKTIYKDGDTWASYDDSRAGLVNLIHDKDIKNVVLVSGDIHTGGAIDDGTNSDFPELSVALANEGFANTGGGVWSVGRWEQYTPGFGWVEASSTQLTLKAYGADGALRLSYTVLAQ